MKLAKINFFMGKSLFFYLLYFLISVTFMGCAVSGIAVPPPTKNKVMQIDTLNGIVGDSIIMVTEEILPYRSSRTRTMDLIHTKLEVRFDWENQHLLGTATLELSPYYFSQSQVLLDGKGFEIHRILLIGEEEKEVKYQYDGETIAVELDRNYNKGESLFIQIEYTARPNELEITYGEAIAKDKGLYFINADSSENKPMQIWTQGEPEASRCWFPTIDAPNERTTQEMYITVNDRFTTLSNGILVYSKTNHDGTRTDYWKMDQPHAPYLFMMAIGEYEVVEDSWNDIEVNYYVEPEYISSAKAIFGRTPEMMTFFSDLLKYPYPWEKYSQVVVRDYVSGAMENTTATVFMEDLQIDQRELVDFNWDDIIAHELFHQWFGNLVTAESWANLTLNEAFANYAEYLWYEYKYGKEEADMHALQDLSKYLTEAREKQVDVIRYYYDDPNDMFDSHSYSKGSGILHMLRNYVGDEAFFDALNLYLNTNAFKSVEIHDLRMAFEETTGEDLNWFFNQWFMVPGHPILNVTQDYDSGLLKVLVEQVQDIGRSPVYELPMLVDVWYNGEVSRYSIVITEQVHEFHFNIPVQPDLVIWDAEQQLLGEIKHAKTYKELAFQYRNSDKIRPRYEAVTTLTDSIDLPLNFKIILEALRDSSWQIRQLAVNAFDDYQGNEKEKIEKELLNILEKDPKSLVRADAITILSSFDLNNYVEVFKKQLIDSSYTVLGAALFALSQNSDTSVTQVFQKFEDMENINVVIPIAAYYAISGKSNKYAWFVSQLEGMEDQGLYYLVNLFGQYLMHSDNESKEKGSRILGLVASDHSESTIRLSAFQSLGLIDELESVKKIKNEIVENEKDEELKALFLQFF